MQRVFINYIQRTFYTFKIGTRMHSYCPDTCVKRHLFQGNYRDECTHGKLSGKLCSMFASPRFTFSRKWNLNKIGIYDAQRGSIFNHWIIGKSGKHCKKSQRVAEKILSRLLIFSFTSPIRMSIILYVSIYLSRTIN